MRLLTLGVCAVLLAGCGLADDPRAAGGAAEVDAERQETAAPEVDAQTARPRSEAVEVVDGDKPGTEWFAPVYPEAADVCRASGASGEAIEQLDGSATLADFKQRTATAIAAVRWTAEAAAAIDTTIQPEGFVDVWEAFYAAVDATTTSEELTLVLEDYEVQVQAMVDSPEHQAWWSEHCTIAD